jgi:hypothetical protein
VGMTTVTGTPSSFPWYAKARAWLPAEAAMTPRSPDFCSRMSCRIAFRAPRSLKLPVNCRNSVLRYTLAPTSSEMKGDFSHVVLFTPPRIATSARLISAKLMGRSVRSTRLLLGVAFVVVVVVAVAAGGASETIPSAIASSSSYASAERRRRAASSDDDVGRWRGRRASGPPPAPAQFVKGEQAAKLRAPWWVLRRTTRESIVLQFRVGRIGMLRQAQRSPSTLYRHDVDVTATPWRASEASHRGSLEAGRQPLVHTSSKILPRRTMGCADVRSDSAPSA